MSVVAVSIPGHNPLPAQTLHLLLVAFGGRERLEANAHVEDLVSVLPHHEARQEAHQGCHQVESHLQKEVQAEHAGQAAAVGRVLVHEGPAEGVCSVQFALAGLQDGVAGELCQLQVMVCSKSHCQNTSNQSQGTQEKIQQLKEREKTQNINPLFPAAQRLRNTQRTHARVLCRDCIPSMFYLEIGCFNNCKAPYDGKFSRSSQELALHGFT